MFEKFDTSKYYKKTPPADDSFRTMQEIKELLRIPINKKFIKDKDNSLKTFKLTADKVNIDIPVALIDRLIDSSVPVIMDLKNFFNRPRPKEIALKLGIDFPNVELNSMKTPSYPSGHSAQAFLIGYLLSDMFPKYKEQFMKTAKDISYSRNAARCHYRTDSKFGMYLGKEMYKHYKKSSPMKKRLEWNDSKYPDAKGKFRDLSAEGLASWLMKTRGKTNLKAIIGSLNQQINFNTKDSDKAYRDKMERTKNIVRKRMGKDSPMKKQKGGGTTKTCLPAAKIKSLSKEKRQQLVSSKKAAGAQGKYKRSSKTNVKGARKPGATLRDWFQKEDWRRVDDPSKKCGE